MLWQEQWLFEFEAFDGGWALADDVAMVSVAHILVIRVVANAIRRRIRGEDLHDDISSTLSYLADLPLAAHHRRAFNRLLDALTPFDPARVTEDLLHACALAGADGRDGAARGLAELAYEAGASFELDGSAQGAALALSGLAAKQEAPWSSRKWRAIARMHRVRSHNRRFA